MRHIGKNLGLATPVRHSDWRPNYEAFHLISAATLSEHRCQFSKHLNVVDWPTEKAEENGELSDTRTTATTD